MSILVKEDYVNPEIPLWAKNGSSGGSGAIIVACNAEPQVYFNEFYDGSETILQTVTVPTFSKSGKLMVQVNWNIDSGGFDAMAYLITAGNYFNNTITTNCGSSKGWFGTSDTYCLDYTANISNYNIDQRVQVDTGGGTRTLQLTYTYSVIFYPNP